MAKLDSLVVVLCLLSFLEQFGIVKLDCDSTQVLEVRLQSLADCIFGWRMSTLDRGCESE